MLTGPICQATPAQDIIDQAAAASAAWAALVNGVDALVPEARMQARQLVADTFERIVIYHRGLRPVPSRWRAGEELALPGPLPSI